MQTFQKTWFKSAFDDESYTNKKRPFPRNESNDSIDLTIDTDENQVPAKRLHNNNEPFQVPSVQQIDTNFKSSNWIENFAPRSKVDLAIHAKKIAELEDWFCMASMPKAKCSAPILMINGPSGSGKTTTLKVIAGEFGYTISEWITPLDVEHVRHTASGNDYTWTESQSDKFSQFLFQSSRYASVFDSGNTKRLVLVEDFPNIFIRDQTLFADVLEWVLFFICIFWANSMWFLMFVYFLVELGDTWASVNPLWYLWSPIRRAKHWTLPTICSLTLCVRHTAFQISGVWEPLVYILLHAFNQVSNSSFNTVSDTLLKKGLNRICMLLSQPGFAKYYTQPDKTTIESIALSSQGDIRNAVISLHFASQKSIYANHIIIINISTNTNCVLIHRRLSPRSFVCDRS